MLSLPHEAGRVNKRAAYAALLFKNIKRHQLSAASFLLSGNPIAAVSFTS